jgi:hypothetical protein
MKSSFVKARLISGSYPRCLAMVRMRKMVDLLRPVISVIVLTGMLHSNKANACARSAIGPVSGAMLSHEGIRWGSPSLTHGS